MKQRSIFNPVLPQLAVYVLEHSDLKELLVHMKRNSALYFGTRSEKGAQNLVLRKSGLVESVSDEDGTSSYTNVVACAGDVLVESENGRRYVGEYFGVDLLNVPVELFHPVAFHASTSESDGDW